MKLGQLINTVTSNIFRKYFALFKELGPEFRSFAAQPQ